MESKNPEQILYFEFVKNADPKSKSEEYLQIVSVTSIGDISREIKQKIIRLNDERQRELYVLLAAKFEVSTGSMDDEMGKTGEPNPFDES